ncbi:hypothetical protein ACVWW2_007974 [Bradyrhizobium sp. LM4.3]
MRPVVAAACNQRLGAVASVMQLEFEAGVIVETASERGREAGLLHVDTARSHEADPAFELVDSGSEVELRVSGERAQLGDSVVGIAGDSEESFEHGDGLARQRAALQRRLLQEAVGDLGRGAAADIGGAGDRHQIGDEGQRGLAVGAGQRGQHALIFAAGRRSCGRQPLPPDPAPG